MDTTLSETKTTIPRMAAWWLLFAAAAAFGLFAIGLGVIEILAQLGLHPDAKHRELPSFFVIHAFFGAIALVTGVLQLSRRLQHRRVGLHRTLGRVYLVSIGLAGFSAMVIAVAFNVSAAAKVVFEIVGALWIATTAKGYLLILKRRIDEHRAWMIRSVAVSFFFVTFPFWVDGLAATPLPHSFAYPFALSMSCVANLIVAEVSIRTSRRRTVAKVPGKQETEQA